MSDEMKRELNAVKSNVSAIKADQRMRLDDRDKRLNKLEGRRA